MASPQALDKSAQTKALFDQAESRFLSGKVNEATTFYESVLKLDLRHDASYGRLGAIYALHGHLDMALDRYAMAIMINPEVLGYKIDMVGLLRSVTVQKFDEAFKNIILTCLLTPELDVSTMAGIWYGILKHDPSFKPVLKAGRKANIEAFEKEIDASKAREALTDPYFLLGLERLVVADRVFEQFLTFLRHSLLRQPNAKLAKALSHYALTTEYIFTATQDEEDQVAVLKNDANTDNLFLLACYVPLRNLENAEDIARKMRGDFPAFTKAHIDEFIEQSRLRAEIPKATKIEDDVSNKVRNQYEEFPYPQWKGIDRNIRNEVCEGYLRGRKAEILVAGCGTGREAIELAVVFPDATVTAIDLSLTSLSYGVMRANELGIQNVKFAQGDILALGELGKQFDYITASGVLHHMKDPMRGWAVLNGLLKPGGAMRVALYSEAARRAIVKVRGVIADKGYSSIATDIRRFRGDAEGLLDSMTLNDVSSFYDYYTVSECRDLLFHVQEHRYTPLQIADMLSELKLEFQQFYLSPIVFEMYRKANPTDKNWTDLKGWAAFENKNPQIFRGMYRFWCRKAA